MNQAKKRIVSALVAVFLLSSAAAALSACNATEGFGQDVSSTGRDISKAARDNK